MPRPTITDVASAAGVSKGAVSFALNGRPGISAETRQRILDAAESLGWTPSARARALSVSRSLAVGLVIARPPEILRADAFFPAFIAGLEEVLSAREHALLLQIAEHDDLTTYRRLAQEARVDGVFLTDLRIDDERPALLEELGLPCVLIGPELTDARFAKRSAVWHDDAEGVREVVRHLVELGHTRIAHVAGPSHLVHGRSRRQAWHDGLAAADLPDGPCIEADFSAESGARAMRELLALEDRPTAVMFANDLMAMAGMSVALASGVSVPGDISVTGFDDIELAAHLQPPLTSVNNDVVAWGRAAATTLLDVIDQLPSTPPTLPDSRLVVRGSTGPRTDRPSVR
jgi:LacI family repressor for deo operon, udp, cdd, tsx, nupC, and nupG